MPFPTTESSIELAERALSVRLPDSLRQYLLRSNGGEVATEEDDWRVFPVFDDSNRRRAARSASHLIAENHVALGWRSFPAGAVAIAENGSGDYLVLLKAGTSERPSLSPQVYKWSHETAELSVVAPDFAALIPE